MTNIVQHKRGTSIPTAADLSVGEIGINMTSQKIYTKDTGGTIIELSPPNTPGGSNTQLQFNDDGIFAGASAVTYDKNTGNLDAFQINTTFLDTGSANVGGLTRTISIDVSTTATIDDLVVANLADLTDAGNVRIYGGTAGQVLTTDGASPPTLSWTTAGGSPAGSNSWVQYNDNGVFGAAPTFRFNNSNSKLTVDRADISLDLTVFGTGYFNDPNPSVGAPGIKIGGGTAGQVLTTNGSGALSWTTVSATPAGSIQQIQYNDGGVFGASADLIFDSGSRLLYGYEITADILRMDSGGIAYFGDPSGGVLKIAGGAPGQVLTAMGVSGEVAWRNNIRIENGFSSVSIPSADGSIFIGGGPSATSVYVAPSLTVSGAIIQSHLALGAGSAIDVSAADYFSKTITGATTFSIVNTAPSNFVSSFILVLTDAGTNVTWWSGVKWEGGTVPTLTTSGTDILGFFTYDNGTTWRGFVLAKDSK